MPMAWHDCALDDSRNLKSAFQTALPESNNCRSWLFTIPCTRRESGKGSDCVLLFPTCSWSAIARRLWQRQFATASSPQSECGRRRQRLGRYCADVAVDVQRRDEDAYPIRNSLFVWTYCYMWLDPEAKFTIRDVCAYGLCRDANKGRLRTSGYRRYTNNWPHDRNPWLLCDLLSQGRSLHRTELLSLACFLIPFV